MRVKNPIGFVPKLEALPGAPAVGDRVELVVDGAPERLPVYYDGATWRSADRTALLATAGAGLLVRESAIVVDGTVRRCDVTIDDRCDGIVQAIVDGMAIVRRMGLVHGFVGLTPGKLLAVGAVAGSVVEQPFAANLPRIMRLGYVYDATTALVDVLESVGI